ncbi:MAG: TIGR00266 family protein [Pseudanabaenaceae cyanobacterium SKYGB_i_bin29]|nr:TIGR00266 family protein [Pseudanabaenaceae cyanobacterium SKYG29]MDW8422255.1 TIGR00266 family protein [Pseudanabaenaceae cyanobacterium SKYGB_i_bin29]
MDYEIKFKPAFASLFVTLQPGEAIVAEPGAMVSMDAGITMTTRIDWNSFLLGLLGGESIFINVFKNTAHKPQTIVFSTANIGDMASVEIDNRGLCVQSGGFVACTPDVKLGAQWAGWASFFGGEGLFRLKLTGRGKAFIGCFGAISERQIPGIFVVDTGHLVAYDPDTKIKIRWAGSWIGSIKSGEGLVMELTGRGKIYLQSRSEDGLVRFLRPKF